MSGSPISPTISSDSADRRFRAGLAHARAGEYKAAAQSFREAVECNPGHAQAQNNLGSSLAALGLHEEAAEAFQRAIDIDPNYAQPNFNLGASLQVLGDSDRAFACFVRTVEIDPGHDEAYYYLGLEHRARNRPNEALACFVQSIEINPGYADVFEALGSMLLQFRLYDQALQAFERALALNPELEPARAQLMHLLARQCAWDKLSQHEAWISRLGIGGQAVQPFNMLAFEDAPERHRIRSEKIGAAYYSEIRPLKAPARPRSRPDQLRIGYFSADFRDHATMYLAGRMFELHDRQRFSTHAYCYSLDQQGETRNRARRAFAQFTIVNGLDNEAVAQLARENGIDIAVDLKGYTQHQRLGILAYRPAPVQISYLGYPGTTGVPFIDYLIADSTVIPDEQRSAYSERLIYLPGSYQVNDDTRPIPVPVGTRADHGLPEGFVFCSFNSSYKISELEFGIWMDLLRKVDGSVLWLLASDVHVEGNLKAAASRRGIDPKRIILAPKVPVDQHLARQGFADLFLDTFNCNAHTTASDALWAGLPIVTKAGRGFAARVSASLLNAVGMPELITPDERAYVKLAVALAKDRDRLAATRAKLALNRTTYPLFDSQLTTRHIEQAYDRAYARYLDGQEPDDIII